MTSEPALPPRTRRGRPGHDQEAVLRKAIDVFNRRGYDATSMDDLASELGLSKSAIYHHVPSKVHLLEAALDEGLGALERLVDRARTSTDGRSAHDRLLATVTDSVEILVAHLPAVTLVLRIRGNSEVEVEALRRRRRIDAGLTALVRDAVDEGTLRGDIDPDLISRLLFGMVNSLAEWYRPGGATDASTVAAALTGIAFDGLTTQPDRPTG